jgi:DNA-binding beta-propeller fold protein YncE
MNFLPRLLVMSVSAFVGVGGSSVLGAETAIRQPDLTILQTISGGDGDARFDLAAVDSKAHRLYVARGYGVMAVDLLSGQVTHQLVPGKHVHAVVPLPDGQVLSTNGDLDTATLFDGVSGKVRAEISTGQNPDAAVFDSATGLVFVMDGKDGTVTVIDPVHGGSPGRFTVGGKLEAAVADGLGRIFVNVENNNEIAVIDTAQRKVLTRYPLAGCDGPTGLALDQQKGLLVAACSNRLAVGIRASDGKQLSSVPIDRHPDAVIFDASRKVFLIPCGRDGTLPIIAESGEGGLTVVAKVVTAVGAHTGALDSETGRIYLPTANFHITLTGFAPADGSFRILVFGWKS